LEIYLTKISHAQLAAAIGGFSKHREHVCRTFNDHAQRRNLPIRITAPEVKGAFAAQALRWADRGDDDTGVLHDEQAKTAVECLFWLWRDEKQQGLVLGAMQSGKTTTSLALQWAGPALYLLTGQRAHPFYLISSQTSHEDQTKIELERFLAYYGDLEFAVSDESAAVDDIDAAFMLSPTLAMYRHHILRDTIEDVLAVSSLDEIVHRRVHGRTGIAQIAGLYRRATDGGYRPLMIIDEPQFGAGDRIVEETGSSRRISCMLTRIFENIEDEIGRDRKDHWFVGLSATPFELHDLDRVWKVRQYLSPAYSGFNFFGGSTIADGVEVNPPNVMSRTEAASWLGVPFFANISMKAYDGPARTFQTHARKIEFDGDQEEYRAAVERALRRAITAILGKADGAGPIGVCIRAFNDNSRTERLIERLRLPSTKIEVVRYFGSEAADLSIKRVIARRKRPDLPYVIFVTNRARMADAFPGRVQFFIEFAELASNLNALLQGLLGRACGYGKSSTVIMSDANKVITDMYAATGGGYVHRTSPHSIVVNGFRRGAPSSMIKLTRDMADASVAGFFSAIDRQVVEPAVPPGSTALNPPRMKGGKFRTGPILKIAKQLNLFEHVESKAVREAILPEIPFDFHIVREGETITHKGDRLGYAIDPDRRRGGYCRYTFRRMDENLAARGGAAGRAKGARDVGQHLEPTIYVEKYDPKTDKIIEKDSRADRLPGSWRAVMVTFPLREPIREIRVGEAAYPTMLSPYDDLMTEEEQAHRDGT
jgi:hypothetical protein